MGEDVGMIEAWGELDVRETFAEAARTFADLVRRIPQTVGTALDWGSGICVHWSGTPLAHC